MMKLEDLNKENKMATIDLNRLSINGFKPTQVIEEKDFIKIRFLEHKIDIVEHLFEEMTDYTIIGAHGENPLIIDDINLNLIPIKNIVNIELVYKPAGDVLLENFFRVFLAEGFEGFLNKGE